MAHPADGLWRYIFEKLGFCIYIYFNLTVFTDRSFLNFSTQQVHHKLGTIADTQDRDTQFKNLLCISRGIRLITAVWSTCKDDTFWLDFLDFLNTCFIGVNLAVYITFSDTACNQLIVLSTEV